MRLYATGYSPVSTLYLNAVPVVAARRIPRFNFGGSNNYGAGSLGYHGVAHGKNVNNPPSTLGHVDFGDLDVTQVVAGDSSTCFLLSEGQVKCKSGHSRAWSGCCWWWCVSYPWLPSAVVAASKLGALTSVSLLSAPVIVRVPA